MEDEQKEGAQPGRDLAPTMRMPCSGLVTPVAYRTPDITLDIPQTVYPPGEDTFLFMDALSKEMAWLASRGPGQVAVEVGSGSGGIVCFLAMHMAAEGAATVCFATDIVFDACQVTVDTSNRNKVPVESICGRLTSPLDMRLRGAVDILLCNPPYVPTPQSELRVAQAAAATASLDRFATCTRDSGAPASRAHRGSEVSLGPVSASWAGGRLGMEVTCRVLDSLECLLSPQGVAYVVLVQENRPREVLKTLRRTEPPWDTRIICRRTAGAESLFVARIARPGHRSCRGK